MAARASFVGISVQPVQGVPWLSAVVPLEAVAFLLQGGEVSGHHEARFAMEKNPFPFRTSMLKVTVNLSPAFGAHRLYQSAGHHWITMYITCFAVVGPLWILFPFSIPQSLSFVFFSGVWIMLLIYITPLLPEFLTVVIPAHIAASTIFVMFHFWLTSEDKFVWFLLPVAKYFSG